MVTTTLTEKSIPGVLDPSSGKVAWKSPSNIALIKYWGKKGPQIPANPSLSFTLSNSITETELTYHRKKEKSDEVELLFSFEGKEQPEFAKKIRKYLNGLREELPFLKELSLKINSSNTFPHSCGIASSASGMSALALCLTSLEEGFTRSRSKEEFYQRASYLARLGSGSACRSVYGGLACWGAMPGLERTSDEYAIPYPGKVDEVFRDFQDAILVVSREQKAVSSRRGHALMEEHPFAEKRYEQALVNFKNLQRAIEQGDLEAFTQTVENEALSLHGLMMSSTPPVVLMLPQTLEIIHRIKNFREQTGTPICFTLDAGPNIHLLYPKRIKDDVGHFVNQELIVYCARSSWIGDEVGAGPVRLT